MPIPKNDEIEQIQPIFLEKVGNNILEGLYLGNCISDDFNFSLREALRWEESIDALISNCPFYFIITVFWAPWSNLLHNASATHFLL